MAMVDKLQSPRAHAQMAARQGGSFFLNKDKTYLSYDNNYISTSRSLRTNKGLPFKFSIFNYYENKEEVELGLIVNPTDITIGQSFVASNSYTRQSWLSALWGGQQQTIACAGVSPAFYIGAGTEGMDIAFNKGLTAENRKETLGFINFMGLVAMYKNNGNYYLDGATNKSLFSNNEGYGSRGRVIGVMDSILLSYDGSEYVGSFNAFTLTEDPSKPFHLIYNFEFVVSCMRGDAMDGHLRIGNNNQRSPGEPEIPLAIQGQNVSLTQTIGMSTEDINSVFKITRDTKEITYEEYVAQNTQTTNDLQTSVVENLAAQEGVGGIITTESGTQYTVSAPPGQKNGDLSGDQILANVGGGPEDGFSRAKAPTVLQLYRQDCNRAGQTYGEFVRSATAKLGYDMDPMVLTTLLTVEPGRFLTLQNGVAVPSLDAVGDNGRSLGITQIIDSTYEGMRSSRAYQQYMAGLGYGDASTLNHQRCQSDPTYAIASTLYLLSTLSKDPDIGDDPIKQIIAYNSGAGRLDKSTLHPATKKYILTYKGLSDDYAIRTEADSQL
jgi:hypothetical protein